MSIKDTIAAVSTGNSISAIGIVRVSGQDAITAAERIFRSASNIKLADATDRVMYYGELFDASGDLIDLCLCMISRAPNSYTGENTVEFHCHGSPVVLSQLLDTLFSHGIRQAKAGEFTKRAFLNGRMDLTQAEAVIDLIEAESLHGVKNAAGQLSGAVCEKVDAVYTKLIDILAHFHAVIDYPDDDVDAFEMQVYKSVLLECETQLRRLLDTHERGKLLRSGIPAAIAGRANTGKSSLLNRLLGYERAIVTEYPGTTRDTIEEKLRIGNVLLRLIDTAGIRDTGDIIEQHGLERTRSAIENAQLIIMVFDGSQPLQEDDYKVIKTVADSAQDDAAVIIAINKSDLEQVLSDKDFAGYSGGAVLVSLSALTGEGFEGLIEAIGALFPDYQRAPAGEVITGTRQAQALAVASVSLQRAVQALCDDISPDAVVTDIESALQAVGEITGKTMREDIISRIFDRFCVGK